MARTTKVKAKGKNKVAVTSEQSVGVRGLQIDVMSAFVLFLDTTLKSAKSEDYNRLLSPRPEIGLVKGEFLDDVTGETLSEGYKVNDPYKVGSTYRVNTTVSLATLKEFFQVFKNNIAKQLEQNRRYRNRDIGAYLNSIKAHYIDIAVPNVMDPNKQMPVQAPSSAKNVKRIYTDAELKQKLNEARAIIFSTRTDQATLEKRAKLKAGIISYRVKRQNETLDGIDQYIFSEPSLRQSFYDQAVKYMTGENEARKAEAQKALIVGKSKHIDSPNLVKTHLVITIGGASRTNLGQVKQVVYAKLIDAAYGRVVRKSIDRIHVDGVPSVRRTRNAKGNVRLVHRNRRHGWMQVSDERYEKLAKLKKERLTYQLIPVHKLTKRALNKYMRSASVAKTDVVMRDENGVAKLVPHLLIGKKTTVDELDVLRHKRRHADGSTTSGKATHFMHQPVDTNKAWQDAIRYMKSQGKSIDAMLVVNEDGSQKIVSSALNNTKYSANIEDVYERTERRRAINRASMLQRIADGTQPVNPKLND